MTLSDHLDALGVMPKPTPKPLRPVKWLLERAIRRRMGVVMPRLDRQQRAILHLADKLEAELWARRHGVTGTHDCDKLQALADKLGLGEVVRGMLCTTP